MREKTIKIYTFEELSEQAKEKAVNDFLNSPNYLNDDWAEYILLDMLEKIKEMDFEIDSKVLEWEIYSRSNQLSINRSDLFKALKSKYPTLYDLDIPNKFGVYTNYLGGGLCSGLNKSELKEDCAILEEFDDNGNEIDLENTIIAKKVYDDLSYLLEIFEETYSALYEEYDYLNSEEYAKQYFNDMEVDFDEEGELI